MGADHLAQAVRDQLALGRLLPLGDAEDCAWLAESAATAVLHAAARRAVPGGRLGRLRLGPADQEAAVQPSVPLPPSALPPSPLLAHADLAAPAGVPVQAAADRVRTALLEAAERELGLAVARVDLRVTDVLDPDEAEAGRTEAAGEGVPAERTDTLGHRADEHPPAPADHPQATATAETVIAVPGVTRLAPVLGPVLRERPAGAVSVVDRRTGAGSPADGPGTRHLQIQIAVEEGRRVLDVARSVRQAAARAAAWDAPEPAPQVTVAVLVTALDPSAATGTVRTV